MIRRQAIWANLALAALLAGAAAAAAQPPRVDPNVTRTSATGAKPAAVVNGEPIALNEVKRLLDQRPPSPLTLTKEQQKAMRQAALDMLIDDVLMRQYLAKHVGQVDAAAYTREMQTLQEALKKQNKSLEQFLKENHLSSEQLRTDMLTRLQWKSLVQRHCPEAQLRKYYQENKVFFDKVIVTASHILVKVSAKATAEQRQMAQQKLLAIRSEIAAGKLDFATAAKKYSDCPSKEKGGSIGPFPYKFVVVEPFARAAFALRPGQMSDVVATDFGYHLIKVTDRSPGEPSNFETMRDMIREVWAQDVELHQRILAEQRKTSRIEVNLQ